MKLLKRKSSLGWFSSQGSLFPSLSLLLGSEEVGVWLFLFGVRGGGESSVLLSFTLFLSEGFPLPDCKETSFFLIYCYLCVFSLSKVLADGLGRFLDGEHVCMVAASQAGVGSSH